MDRAHSRAAWRSAYGARSPVASVVSYDHSLRSGMPLSANAQSAFASSSAASTARFVWRSHVASVTRCNHDRCCWVRVCAHEHGTLTYGSVAQPSPSCLPLSLLLPPPATSMRCSEVPSRDNDQGSLANSSGPTCGTRLLPLPPAATTLDASRCRGVSMGKDQAAAATCRWQLLTSTAHARCARPLLTSSSSAAARALAATDVLKQCAHSDAHARCGTMVATHEHQQHAGSRSSAAKAHKIAACSRAAALRT
jgi:hypothetical protein